MVLWEYLIIFSKREESKGGWLSSTLFECFLNLSKREGIN